MPGLLTAEHGPAGEKPPTFFGAYYEWMQSPLPDWDTWRGCDRNWDGPFMVKGVSRVDDASGVVDLGATALSVSNHGGNNLDGTPAPIRALPAVVDAVGDQIEVLLDERCSTRERRGEGPGARRARRDDRTRVPVGDSRRRSGRRENVLDVLPAASTRRCSPSAGPTSVNSNAATSSRPDDFFRRLGQ